MADTKITELTELTTAAGGDILPIVDDPSGTPVTKKITLTNIASFLASLTQTLTNKMFDLTDNTLTGTIAEFNNALSDADFATLAGTETLSGKTISGANNTITNINRAVGFYVVEATTDLETGDGVAYLPPIPSFLNGMVLSAVMAQVITAGETGTTDIQIHNLTDAQDMLSTLLTIDSEETKSSDAETPAVIDPDHDDVATGDVLRIDIDAVSTTAPKGLVITLEFSN